MKLGQTVSIKQQVTLSPKLIHGLRVLKLSSLELRDLVQEQLLENPALELSETGQQQSQDDVAETESQDASESAGEAEREVWDDYSRGISGAPVRSGATEATNDPVEQAASPDTLRQHLMMQLDIQDIPEAQRRAGEIIIDSLDDDGYLREDMARVAELAGVGVREAEAALAVVQLFDPAGIASRDLAECLLNQMDGAAAEGLPGRIVSNYLQELARGSHCRIAQELSVSSLEVKEAVSLIREMDPSPGAAFEPRPPAASVIPDVYIRKVHGELAVVANREVTPRLSVSNSCRSLAKRPGITKAESDYIRERIAAASELIGEIEKRRLTLTDVARSIAEVQPEFFESGPSKLRPASLDDVAQRLDVHASTVSRAIQGKYLATAFGIFEFCYFFPSGCPTEDGRKLGAPAIQKQLADLIESEDSRRPLSDERLSKLLGEAGIRISRRTVAKYREELGIPASYNRRWQ